MKLSVVLQDVNVESNYQEQNITGITLDSRKVKPGFLFLALQGHACDGKEFIADAMANGAIAVLVDERKTSLPDSCIFVPDLRKQLGNIARNFYSIAAVIKNIAITGTNGKTSVAHLIAQIFSKQGSSCATIGTMGNGFVGKELQNSGLTTPDCISVYQTLSELAAKGAELCTIEASSHALEQQRLSGIDFSTVVFTNFTQDHLDYHQTMDSYWQAKKKLFTDYCYDNLVVNLDDEKSLELITEFYDKKNIVGYTLTENSSAVSAFPNIQVVKITDVVIKEYKTTATVAINNAVAKLTTNILGKFNLSNIAAAIAVCIANGVTLESVVATIANLEPINGRMMPVMVNNSAAIPQVVIDYAHTEDALIKALSSLQDYLHPEGKLWCIFGCGGDRDRGKRAPMLAAALSLSDKVIVTSDNPRTEDLQQIISDMLQGAEEKTKILIELDRAKAIMQAIILATEKDIILVAGKGHEDYQIIGTEKVPSSDLAYVKQALENRGSKCTV